jgi:SNF2 family DNA or RNA helicase
VSSNIEKEELLITFEASTYIRFNKGFSVPQQVWSEVVSWWGPVIVESNGNLSFDVAIYDFEVRKDWLRDYWVNEGHTVRVDSDVISKIQNLKTSQNLFEDLASSFWSPTEDEVENFEPGLIRPLTKMQIRNVFQLLRMPHGSNFSVPGAGKTTTELVVWNLLRARGMIEKMLVVCPRSAFESWQDEGVNIFSSPPEVSIFNEDPISSSTQILITNYEQLENQGKLNRLLFWTGTENTLLVIDEAHRIKGGANSIRWKACKRLSLVARRTDLLTGTPLPQGLDDLRNLLTLAWKDLPLSYLTESRIQGLRRGGIYVRTTKEELGLPPVTIREVLLPMGPVQSEIYSALSKSYAGSFQLSEMDQKSLQKRGRAVFSLIAAATNPGLLLSQKNDESFLNLIWPPIEIKQNPWMTEILGNYSLHEIPPKYTWLINLIRDRSTKGKKVIVWSNFVGNLRALEKLLSPYGAILIYGATPIEERKAKLDEFRFSTRATVLLTNPQTLGEGVSLHQVCHEAVYLDRTYNAGHYLQSVDRIHRLGLPIDQETEIHFLISERTIDERVENRLAIKIERLARVMEDNGLVIGSIPNSDEDESLSFAGIDDEDLDDLFSHLILEG